MEHISDFGAAIRATGQGKTFHCSSRVLHIRIRICGEWTSVLEAKCETASGTMNLVDGRRVFRITGQEMRQGKSHAVSDQGFGKTNTSSDW